MEANAFLETTWRSLLKQEGGPEGICKVPFLPGVVVHVFNSSTQEGEEGGSPSLRPAWSTKASSRTARGLQDNPALNPPPKKSPLSGLKNCSLGLQNKTRHSSLFIYLEADSPCAPPALACVSKGFTDGTEADRGGQRLCPGCWHLRVRGLSSMESGHQSTFGFSQS